MKEETLYNYFLIFYYGINQKMKERCGLGVSHSHLRSVKMEEHEANSSSDSEAEDLRLLALIDQTRAKVMVLTIILFIII